MAYSTSKDPFEEFGGKAIEVDSDPFAEFGGKELSSKKKVPTEPTSTESLSGSEQTPRTGGLEPSQSPKTTTIKVGGKDFTVPEQKELTSKEVVSQANILFKNASPVNTDVSVKIEAEPAFKNVSPKIIKGNEDVLDVYVKNLPDDEKDRLRKKKFTDEESVEILNKAYVPYLNSLSSDLNVLKERGAESDLLAFESRRKELEKIKSTIEQDQKQLQNLNTTFLNQKGYDKLAKEYEVITAQMRNAEKVAKPLLDQRKQLEAQLNQFTPLIQGGQFNGSKEQYDQYTQIAGELSAIDASPELQKYNETAGRINGVAKQINSIVTPEYKERADKLSGTIRENIASYEQTASSLEQDFTPEQKDNMTQFIDYNNQFRKAVTDYTATKGKFPELIQKEEDVTALNLMNPDIISSIGKRGYDLAAKTWNGFAGAVGDLASFAPAVAGGLSEGYTMSDRAAESISNFFAPKLTTSQTEVAGQAPKLYKPFYDSETENINWASMPDEIANQVGAFALLAATGGAGRVAGLSDAAAIVLPGTMMSYNDAYKTGNEIYGDDRVSATLYASASSLITGITELIMPDRDILTGALKDKIAKEYVTEYLKGGSKKAIEKALKTLFVNIGKENVEELVDRWKDVALRGAVNLTGGDIDLDIPSLQEQLSIVASTSALTGLAGTGGVSNETGNIRKLALYQAAQNYPETLKQLDALESQGVDVADVKNQVGNLFFNLKQIPTTLSPPKQVAISEKLDQINQIENINASGVSPVIQDIGNKKIKGIQTEIENIINDDKFDEQFASEVNKEVEAITPQPTETVTPPTEEVVAVTPESTATEEVPSPTETVSETATENIPSEQPTPTESDIVKNPVLKRLNKAFLKIGTTVMDNAEQLMNKAKELSGARYMYVGKNARLSESAKENFAKAKNLKQQGVRDEDIRKETGWFTAKDGEWRIEISDKNLKVLYSAKEMGDMIQNKGGGNMRLKLNDILDAKELFSAYPELQHTNVIATKLPNKPNEVAYYDTKSNTIIINTSSNENNADTRNSIIHEIQHTIQQREGFNGGTSYEESLRWVLKNSNVDAKSYELLPPIEKAHFEQLAANRYLSKLGEVEARDSAERSDFSDDERKLIPPYSDSDVPSEDIWYHLDKDGEILGFTHNGQIYLNGEKVTANTTMEEAGHIWINWAAQNRPDLHQAGLDKVKGSKYEADVNKNKHYKSEALKQGKEGSPEYNRYMQEEALAKAIADNGAKFVTETRRNSFKEWVNEMWKAVAKSFGIKNLSPDQISKMSLEQFAKMAAADTFDTSTPTKPVSEEGVADNTIAPKRRKKALLNRAYDGTLGSLQEELAKYDLEYDVENQQIAKENAEEFVGNVGMDGALQAARSNLVKGAMNTYVWAIVLDDAEVRIGQATTDREKMIAITHAAAIADEFDRIVRDPGRRISALNDVYKSFNFPYRVGNLLKRAKDASKDGFVSKAMQEKLMDLSAKFEDVSAKLKEHEQKVKELEEKIAFEKIQAEIAFEKGKKESNKDKAKKLADQFRKLKTKPFVLKDENGNPINFETLGFTLNDAIEGIAKIIEKSDIVLNAVDAIRLYLKDQAWYNKLTDQGKAAVQSQLLDKFAKESNPTASVDVSEDGKLIIPPSLIRSLVESGIDNIDDLTKAVHKLFEAEYTDITERQVRDAITEYGKQRFPSEDEINRKISELKRDGKLLSGLEDSLSGKAPLRSGYLRPKPTDAQREMQRKIKDAMKNLPEDEADVQRQWATAQDRIRQLLENRIADLQKQIDTGVREVRNVKRTILSDENKLLQEQVAELNKQLDALVGEKKLTYEQRVNNAIAAAERTLKDLNERIANKDLAFKAKDILAETPELKAARDAVKAQREVFNQMRQEAGVAEQRRMELFKNKLKKDIAEYEARLREKRFDKKTRKEPVELDRAGQLLEAERLRLKEEVDIEIEKLRLKNRTKVEKLRDTVADAMSIPTSLVASGDLSSLLRQGVILGSLHPVMAAKALKTGVEFAFSQKKYEDYMRAIKVTPEYVMMKKAGLYLTEPSARLSAKEEQFMSNLAHKIPVIGKLIKASERAYTGQLNKLRVDVFMDFLNTLEQDGYKGKELADNLKGFSGFINEATGRGTLPKSVAQASPFFNPMFFALRFVASRFNILGRVLTAGGIKMPPAARKEAIKTLLAYAGVSASILALAMAAGGEGDDDPTSSGFGKIKFGDISIDIFAGFQQIVVFLARLRYLRTTNATTGEQEPLYQGGFNEKNVLTVAGDFIESKYSPAANILQDLATQKYKYDKSILWYDLGKKGDKPTAEGLILSNLFPIWQQDLWDIQKDMGAGATIGAGAASFFGYGMQYYEPNPADLVQRETYDMLKKSKGNQEEIREELFENIEKNIVPLFDEKYDKSERNRKIRNAIKDGVSLYYLDNAPDWQKSVYYSGTNDIKRELIDANIKGMSKESAQESVKNMYKNHIISKDVAMDYLPSSYFKN